MDQQTDIDGRIEATRLRLLRLVSLWLMAIDGLAAVRCQWLPPRLGAFVCQLIARAELAAAYLLVALVARNGQGHPRLASDTKALLLSGVRTCHRLTADRRLFSIVQRLLRLRAVLISLPVIARCLARNAAIASFLALFYARTVLRGISTKMAGSPAFCAIAVPTRPP